MGYGRSHMRYGHRFRGHYRSYRHVGIGFGGVVLAIILILLVLHGLGHV